MKNLPDYDCMKAIPKTEWLLCLVNAMRKSCKYCGRSHEYGEVCPKKIRYRNKYESKPRVSLADRFRNSRIWREKRSEIQRRDLYICRYCFCMEKKIHTSDLSVHHIIPIEKNYNLRLDNGNLITLCRLHHEQAEKGLIKPDILQNLLAQQIKI